MIKVAEDGHTLVDGARWHWPAPLDPTRCGVKGCDRIMGQSGSSLAHVGAASSEQ